MIQYSQAELISELISVLPEDGDGASPRNVVFKPVNAADRPRRISCIVTLFSVRFFKLGVKAVTVTIFKRINKLDVLFLALMVSGHRITSSLPVTCTAENTSMNALTMRQLLRQDSAAWWWGPEGVTYCASFEVLVVVWLTIRG